MNHPKTFDSRAKITRAQLRQELIRLLLTESVFTCFIMDQFPRVYVEFTGGMSRTDRENYLLASEDEEVIFNRLEEFISSPNYTRMPLLTIHPGGRTARGPLFGYKLAIIWRKIRKAIYIDAILHMLSGFLEWIAIRLGIDHKDADKFRSIRPLFIVILLILIAVALFQRCS